jgi:hypothetical protein
MTVVQFNPFVLDDEHILIADRTYHFSYLYLPNLDCMFNGA